MDPALCFRHGDALDAVHTGFKFHFTIGPCPRHGGDDFFKAAHIGLRFALNLNLPALDRGIARIHGKKVASKNSGFIATCPRADLKHN